MKFFLNKQNRFTPLEGRVKESHLTGFTLIELLVVIGIIAVLSSILYANFNEARMIARDKARMTTLKEVQLALELYKAQYGEYPAACDAAGTGNFAGPGPVSSRSGPFVECSQYISGLVPEFISVLPLDPVFEDESDKGFYYRSDGSRYKFMSYDSVEVNTVNSAGHEFARCPNEDKNNCDLNQTYNQRTYAVYSAGAEDW